MSIDVIESITASVLRLSTSLSFIEFFNSACNALRADEEVVVINRPVSLSTYCTCDGLDNAILKSDIDLVIPCFSILRSSFVS